MTTRIILTATITICPTMTTTSSATPTAFLYAKIENELSVTNKYSIDQCISRLVHFVLTLTRSSVLAGFACIPALYSFLDGIIIIKATECYEIVRFIIIHSNCYLSSSAAISSIGTFASIALQDIIDNNTKKVLDVSDQVQT